jgi:hypothetical protein
MVCAGPRIAGSGSGCADVDWADCVDCGEGSDGGAGLESYPPRLGFGVLPGGELWWVGYELLTLPGIPLGSGGGGGTAGGSGACGERGAMPET